MKKKFELLETKKGHWYSIINEDFPHGINLPSVTNILEAYPNPGLDYWLTNTSPEEIKQKQDDGKEQGTKVHHCCYLMAQGEEIITETGLTDKQVQMLPIAGVDQKLVENLKSQLTKRETNCLEGFENYWEEFAPVNIARELMVYSKKMGYAGTLDWVGYLWDKKKKKYDLWFIDYKISKNHSREYELQLAAYFKAVCEMNKKRYRARKGVLYLGKPTKKKYQLKEVPETNKSFETFKSVKKLWHDLYPNAQPEFEILKESFKVVPNKMKGRRIKIK
jgi:hypothetical protein